MITHRTWGDRTPGSMTDGTVPGRRYFNVPAVSPACTCRWKER